MRGGGTLKASDLGQRDDMWLRPSGAGQQGHTPARGAWVSGSGPVSDLPLEPTDPYQFCLLPGQHSASEAGEAGQYTAGTQKLG